MTTPRSTVEATGKRWKRTKPQLRVLATVRKYNDVERWISPRQFVEDYDVALFRLCEFGMLTMSLRGLIVTDKGREILTAYFDKHGPTALDTKSKRKGKPHERSDAQTIDPGHPAANEDRDRGAFIPLRDVKSAPSKAGEEKVRQHMATITRTMFDAYAAFRPPGEWSPTDDLYRDALVSWFLSLVPPDQIPAGLPPPDHRQQMSGRLGASWMAFETMVLPAGAGLIQRKETRRAFYAGAAAALGTMERIHERLGTADGEPTPAEIQAHRELEGEIAAFFTDIERGRV